MKRGRVHVSVSVCWHRGPLRTRPSSCAWDRRMMRRVGRGEWTSDSLQGLWVCPGPHISLQHWSFNDAPWANRWWNRVKTQGVVCARMLSHVRLFVTPWTVACQSPLSLGFSGEEYWSGLPCPPPGGLPNPGIEPESLVSPAFFTTRAT